LRLHTPHHIENFISKAVSGLVELN
jgi:hypothetical protein